MPPPRLHCSTAPLLSSLGEGEDVRGDRQQSVIIWLRTCEAALGPCVRMLRRPVPVAPSQTLTRLFTSPQRERLRLHVTCSRGHPRARARPEVWATQGLRAPATRQTRGSALFVWIFRASGACCRASTASSVSSAYGSGRRCAWRRCCAPRRPPSPGPAQHGSLHVLAARDAVSSLQEGLQENHSSGGEPRRRVARPCAPLTPLPRRKADPVPKSGLWVPEARPGRRTRAGQGRRRSHQGP